jgi:hypothetical protein
MALRSMKDFDMPPEIHQMLRSKKIKGTIVFFKNRVTHHSAHYSSDSSSSRSTE